MITNRDTFVHIEEGICLYIIEYILLYHYGYMYHNSDDPHQDTQYKLSDLSDGYFHFHLYGLGKGKKYIAPVKNPESFNGDYVFDGVEYPVIMASKLLRNYKINKLITKIRKNEKIHCN